MIELKNDKLVVSFPEIHKQATMSISFQRTLRIPDNEQTHSLPPGLGKFPMEHIDDFETTAPASWIEHGGVMLPMYQSEAMWLNFGSLNNYPFVVKIATGKINAVTGEEWEDGINQHPQDYLQIPKQPWLDGFCVGKGLIRQFVAMPLGKGYTAEEQITGKAESGGLQICIHPMKREAFKKYEKSCLSTHCYQETNKVCRCAPTVDMGLAPGGKMRQEIYNDQYELNEWDHDTSSRCFVHLANSSMWHNITGKMPPHKVPTAEEYSYAGLPWFDYYSDAPALEGSGTLANIKSVTQLGMDKGEFPLPENAPINTSNIVTLGSSRAVREFV